MGISMENLYPGLSLRSGGLGFSPAAMSVAPSYFYWKTEENENQTKFLTV